VAPYDSQVTSARKSLWVGTYPAAGAGSAAGRGEGIWRVHLDASTGTFGAATQVAVTPAPSFVAVHPSGRVLYAVGETAQGTVTAFAVPGTPAHSPIDALDVVGSGGADPCHLLLAPDARTLYVANYSSGTLGVLPLDRDGRFTAEVRDDGGPVQVLGHAGSGPDADRQEGPHAHFVAIAPGGRFLIVVDLGTDELRRYARDPETGLVSEAGIAATLPPGTGPRHLAFAPDGRTAYVVGELDMSVRVLAWDQASASATLVQSLRAGLPDDAPALPDDGTGATAASPRPLPAHLQLDGDRLLVSVRTQDVIAAYAVATNGWLSPAGVTRLPGAWPRHFAVVNGTVVVAEQVGGELVALRADAGPGPGAVTSRLALPAPACVVVA
jgi:6-phosphogluconolactonase (cycloisomerase 2 family)